MNKVCIVLEGECKGIDVLEMSRMHFGLLQVLRDKTWKRQHVSDVKQIDVVKLCVAVLGESDLIYTNTLICAGEESFTDKTALILGGGDGGILHELLKQNPKHVLMAEVRTHQSF